jgi:hypothetical protein
LRLSTRVNRTASPIEFFGSAMPEYHPDVRHRQLDQSVRRPELAVRYTSRRTR